MTRNHLKVLIAAVLYGYIIVGGRLLSNAGFSLIEISFLPLAIVAVIVVLVRPSSTKPFFVPQSLFFFVVFGLIGTILQVTQYGGIILDIPVAVVAMLLYMQPVWTIILSRLILKEKLTRWKFVSLALAMLGVAILLSPGSSPGGYSVIGMVSAFVAGWVLAFWVLWAKRSEKIEGITAWSCLTGYSFFTSFFLLGVFWIEKVFVNGRWLGGFKPELWLESGLEVLSVSIFAYLIPGLLFFSGIAGIVASVAGMLLMLEPVSATFLAAIWFQEPITLNIWIGSALILLANGMLLGRSSGK